MIKNNYSNQYTRTPILNNYTIYDYNYVYQISNHTQNLPDCWKPAIKKARFAISELDLLSHQSKQLYLLVFNPKTQWDSLKRIF